MKCRNIRKGAKKTRRLTVFFCGFGCGDDAADFFDWGGDDAAVFYDYSDLHFPENADLFGYGEVRLAAWSFGVWAAQYFADRLPPLSEKIAICGSFKPVDDHLGIPKKIFELTARNFGESAKQKFRKKANPSGGARDVFSSRAAASQKAELETLGAAFGKFDGTPQWWTRAIAGTKDAIFCIKNMRRAWGDKLETIDAPHMPESVFSRPITDILTPSYGTVKGGFERALSSYNANAVAQKTAALRLADMIARRAPEGGFGRIAELGAGTGILTAALDALYPNAHWFACDICPDAERFLAKILRGDFEFSSLPAETVAIPQGTDLVASASCLQWSGNFPAVARAAADALGVGKIFAFSVFTDGNFPELKTLCGLENGFAAVCDIKEALSAAGFEIRDEDATEEVLRFPSPKDVLRHLRGTGVSAKFRRFWTPAKYRDFCRNYTALYGDASGRVSLTYKAAYFVCVRLP